MTVDVLDPAGLWFLYMSFLPHGPPSASRPTQRCGGCSPGPVRLDRCTNRGLAGSAAI
jgi:hypothetical protein